MTLSIYAGLEEEKIGRNSRGTRRGGRKRPTPPTAFFGKLQTLKDCAMIGLEIIRGRAGDGFGYNRTDQPQA